MDQRTATEILGQGARRDLGFYAPPTSDEAQDSSSPAREGLGLDVPQPPGIHCASACSRRGGQTPPQRTAQTGTGRGCDPEDRPRANGGLTTLARARAAPEEAEATEERQALRRALHQGAIELVAEGLVLRSGATTRCMAAPRMTQFAGLDKI